ncbi:MAG: hypothetical protein VX504_03410 [Thermoproteota archaeon]|nr:hypothetical protein [Thermoproteota archaeon]
MTNQPTSNQANQTNQPTSQPTSQPTNQASKQATQQAINKQTTKLPHSQPATQTNNYITQTQQHLTKHVEATITQTRSTAQMHGGYPVHWSVTLPAEQLTS